MQRSNIKNVTNVILLHMGENTVKEAKVKVLFLGLHMTCVIFVLVYNLYFRYLLNISF